jgi:tRNA(Ile)-lysidine synthase
VLTGHTADDQAETVLLHLLRGAGLDGLAAMVPLDATTGRCRPLLGIRRRETVALCAAHGLEPLHDPSNDDPRFTRNRVRSEVIPLLDSVARRDVAAVLARQAPILRDEAELLDAMSGELDPTDAKLLAGAPPALARRAIRRWLTAALPSGYPPDAAAVERVLVVARGNRVACEVTGGWRVERHRRVLRVVPPDA